jgi:hypothetical protein
MGQLAPARTTRARKSSWSIFAREYFYRHAFGDLARPAPHNSELRPVLPPTAHILED